MKRIHYLTLAAVIVVLDALTKWLVVQRIDLHEAVPIIPKFFQLVHVRNTGAAFGIGANAESHLVPMLLNIGALAVFAVVVVYSFRSAVTARTLQVGLHLILGGAIGNLADRLRQSYVIDFMDVYFRGWHFWAFNVADACITIGAILVFVDLLFVTRHHASHTV